MNTIRFTTVLLLLLSAAAQAQDAPPAERADALRQGFFLAPMYVYTQPDDKRRLGNGRGYALALGYRWSFAALELVGEDSRLSFPGRAGSPGMPPTTPADPGEPAATVRLSGIGINAIVAPFQSLPIITNLYGLVGFGVHQRKNHPGFSRDDDTIVIDAGLGWMFPLRVFDFDFALRAEGIYRVDSQQPPFPNPPTANDPPKSFQDLIGRAGLYLPISRRPAPPAAEPEPEVVVVVPTTAPVDTDGDGVFDPADQCPETPVGTKVDDVGCPLPPPPPPAPPAPPEIIVLEGVLFETASARLKPESTVVLGAAVTSLHKRPEIKVEVGGHTDSVGDTAYNQDLSQRRAETVRAFFIKRGIPAERLSARGYGELMPVDSNDSNAGRARNRRVELKIENQQGETQP